MGIGVGFGFVVMISYDWATIKLLDEDSCPSCFSKIVHFPHRAIADAKGLFYLNCEPCRPENDFPKLTCVGWKSNGT